MTTHCHHHGANTPWYLPTELSADEIGRFRSFCVAYQPDPTPLVFLAYCSEDLRYRGPLILLTSGGCEGWVGLTRRQKHAAQFDVQLTTEQFFMFTLRDARFRANPNGEQALALSWRCELKT